MRWISRRTREQAEYGCHCRRNWATTSNSWHCPRAIPHPGQAWGENEVAPRFTVTAKVATRDRIIKPATRFAYSHSEAQLYLKPTKHMPIDGIVAKTSQSIVKPTMTADEKARAIYEWVVDNTFREPKVRGCGMGNIKFMLESGNLGGKCADINSLFVGLARAAGVPAREVYGVRVAPSKPAVIYPQRNTAVPSTSPLFTAGLLSIRQMFAKQYCRRISRLPIPG